MDVVHTLLFLLLLHTLLLHTLRRRTADFPRLPAAAHFAPWIPHVVVTWSLGAKDPWPSSRRRAFAGCAPPPLFFDAAGHGRGGGIAGVTFGPIPAEMKGCTSCQSPAAYVELRMWKGRGPIFPSRSQGICPTLMSGSANAEILKRILERFPRSL